MTAEGALGLVAGVRAGSIALVGWALGSVIEGLAGGIVIWRFTGARAASKTSERRAQRAVAISFYLLAPYIVVEALRDLVAGHGADTSALGIVVTAASLLVMPALCRAKHVLGGQLDSGATAGEGTQNYLCAAQAAAVLVGLGVTAAVPSARWVDPARGLLLTRARRASAPPGQGRTTKLGADLPAVRIRGQAPGERRRLDGRPERVSPDAVAAVVRMEPVGGELGRQRRLSLAPHCQ